jgi:hypothetical protein
VRTFGRSGKSLAYTRIQGLDGPDRSVVATLVTLPRLRTWSLMNYNCRCKIMDVYALRSQMKRKPLDQWETSRFIRHSKVSNRLETASRITSDTKPKQIIFKEISVGCVTRIWAECPRILVWSEAEVWYLYLPLIQNIQSDHGANLASYSVGKKGGFHSRGPEVVKLTTRPIWCASYEWVKLHFYPPIYFHGVQRDSYSYTDMVQHK